MKCQRMWTCLFSTYVVNRSTKTMEMGKQIKDLSIEELKLFIGIVISMSLNKKNKVEYYWSQEGQAKYAKIISRLSFCKYCPCYISK